MPDDWPAVAEPPPLNAGEVQIWRIDLGEAAADPAIHAAHLTPAELERAGRSRAGEVRMQFVVARACLRVLLGRHLGLRPSDVPIIPGRYGKPELPTSSGHSLFFNVAHARETVLIALCRESGVGVDIEYLDRKTDTLDIARSSFTPREFLHIKQAGTPEEQQRAFFRLWTRKEAVMKADGRGLSIALSAVEVPVSERAVSAPVQIARGQHAAAERGRAQSEVCFITDLEVGEGIAAAVATDLANPRLSTLRFALDWLR